MKHERRPTLREVARRAGVGVMTVSRVINNHASVQPSTRKKVEAAILHLGYQQNEAARLLKGQRAKIIGLIVPDLSDLFFASCAQTVQHIARSHGYMTLIASSDRDANLERAEAELMASRMISGLLIATSENGENEWLRKLQGPGLSIVGFDRPLLGTDASSVLAENRIGAEQAIQHLMDHGHKRIACVGYDEAVHPVSERIAGYTHHMYAAGLQPQVASGLADLDAIRHWLAGVLASANPPTAIFSLNNRTSTFLLQALAEQLVRVPEEIALVGFDDFDLASLMQPPLTTVAQSPVDLARQSINLLLELIRTQKNPDAGSSALKIFLPSRLIVRSSCGAHKTG